MAAKKPHSAPSDKPGKVPCRVLLVRHGKAQRNADSGRDEDRRLKPRGERQAKWLGKLLKDRGWLPALLLHSPVHRAVQTAMRISEHAQCDAKETEALDLGAPATGVVAMIQAKAKPGFLVLVGHNPQLEEVARILVPELRRKQVDLRTGEAILIELPGASGSLDLTKGALVERVRLDDDED